jgi:hypothetical protein
MYHGCGYYLVIAMESPNPGESLRVFFVDPNTGQGQLANCPAGVVQFENVPQPIEAAPFFVNIYPSGPVGQWDTLSQANKSAGENRVACAKIKLTVTPEGAILATVEKV